MGATQNHGEGERERRGRERFQNLEPSITYIFGFGQCYQEMFHQIVTPSKCLCSPLSLTNIDNLLTWPQALCILPRLHVCNSLEKN